MPIKINTGFFSETSFKSEKAASTTPQCGLCGFNKNSKNPRLEPKGLGKKKILIVSGSIGEYEDRYKKHIVGSPRDTLKKALKKHNIDLYRDCWTTSAVICRKSKERDSNYEKANEKIDINIEACRPNLLKVIKELNPKAIILLGSTAAKSLIPVIFKNPVDTNHRWNNYCIPCLDYNAWITFTFYPSNIINDKNSAAKVVFNKAIGKLCKKAHKRPWRKIPDYKSHVEIIYNPAKAARELKVITAFGKDIVFDYEANCLKPRTEGAKIYSCSVCCENKRAISFPWKGEAIDAMDNLLKSPVGKIAANMKFENRWTKVHLGHYVKNWIHDTMIAAHILNNNKKACNLTFQAFVNLGMPCYDQSVKAYLKSTNSSSLNRIHQVDYKDLLLYGGLDSLLTRKLAIKQIKEFNKRSIIK